MRHGVYGKQLSRTKNERRRLLQGLARELIEHGSITTVLAKAKAVQPLVEKLVTHAKNGSAESIKKVLSDWTSTRVLLADAKDRFSKRTSGFTRIVKLGARKGDSSEEVLLSFVDLRVEKPKAIPVKKTAPVKAKAKT